MSDGRGNRLDHLQGALGWRVSRREALKRAAALGLAVPALGATLATAEHAAAQGSSPVKITWFAGRDTTGFTPTQVKAFNDQHTDIQINYQEQGSNTTDLHDKFVTIATAKDSSADMISMDVPFVPEFAAAGWTLPTDDLLPADERSKFFPGTIQGATYNGKLYAVPWFNNGPGLYYRKDLLDAAGLQPPKTYDELVSIAKKLQTPDISGYIYQAAQAEGGVINWMEYLWGYGGEIVDDKLNIVLGESDAGVKALQRLIDYIYTDKISPESCLTMRIPADAENVFISGKAVFLRSWMTAANQMETSPTSKVKGKWDVVPLPSEDGKAAGPGCLGTWNLGISAFSKHPEQVGEAIKFFTSQEQQTARYLGNGNLPARSAVFDDPKVKAAYSYVDRLKPAFQSLKPRPVTPYYSQMSADALQPNFGAAMTRQKTPDQAIKDMVSALKQIVSQ